jgi:uncharacterized protein
MYRKGEGVQQSSREAAHWYRLAATQNFPEAQQKLADLYCTGQGVPLSYTRQAALQGHEQALRELKRRKYRDP